MARRPRLRIVARREEKTTPPGGDAGQRTDELQSPSTLAWDWYVREYKRRAAELGLADGPRTLGALIHGRYPISPPSDAQRADFFARLVDELLPSSLAKCSELAGELGRIHAQREWGAHSAAAQRKRKADDLAARIRQDRDQLIAQGRAPRDVAAVLARRHDLTPQRVRQILGSKEKRK